MPGPRAAACDVLLTVAFFRAAAKVGAMRAHPGFGHATLATVAAPRSVPVMRCAPILTGVAALLVVSLAVAPAQGIPEDQAPRARADVVRAWHEPAEVLPHTQWQGFLRLDAASPIVAASYQVCQVGRACFAPPREAASLGNGTFRFDTAELAGPAGEAAGGALVDFQPGWHVGVKWILRERLANGTVTEASFPEPTALGVSASCDATECGEAHYLTFDIAGAPPRSAAGMTGPGCALGLLALAGGARRMQRHG